MQGVTPYQYTSACVYKNIAGNLFISQLSVFSIVCLMYSGKGCCCRRRLFLLRVWMLERDGQMARMEGLVHEDGGDEEVYGSH